MNPLLLKPERDDHSQVVLLGRVDTALSALPWHDRAPRVWPVVAAALDELRARHDVVVIEGAGSPAEINLMHSDLVNLRVARHADARCLLVCDIDRGGAFAHLYGTWALLPPADQARIDGFVLNRFRGDEALLAPGPEQLRQRTGVPVLATLPMWRDHGLPDEDGLLDERPVGGSGGTAAARTIAVVAWPRISNLDEFQPLRAVPGVRLLWARDAGALDALGPQDWIILPGSKHTSSDLQWLRQRGMDRAVAAHAARGGPVLGICGGLQVLGEALVDPHGIDGNAPGLGLLPLVTVFAEDKTVRAVHARFGPALASAPGPWSALAGLAIEGYEIRHGQTAPHAGLVAAGQPPLPVLEPGLAWTRPDGRVLGTSVHGLFENPAVLRALFGHDAPTLDSVFDGLADRIAERFAPGALAALLADRVPPR